MPFEIVRNNIVNMYVDAIVNTANPYPAIGSGVDTAIHEKAGPKLLEARKQIGDINLGEARLTPAFNLNAKYVIHTVGPEWKDGLSSEPEQLRACYRNCLALAKEAECESIAFPLISTGNYGFPKDLALQIAIGEISTFLLEYEMQVYLVVFDKKSYALSEKLFKAVESYIDENYVEEVFLCEYASAPEPERSRRERTFDIMPMAAPVLKNAFGKAKPQAKRSLEDLIDEVEDTFSESLFRWIVKKDLTNPEVYKKANMDRKLFSKILNNKDYKPSKINAIALAIALELNLDETKDFIGRAGYALTHSSKFDIIVEWFILQGNYDIFEINMTLFEFGQPSIGG